jgi:hypothetical protein
MSRAGCERVLEQQAEGVDLVLGYPVRWGMGYALESPSITAVFGPQLEGRRIACWGGSGGSFVINDLDARFTVAFVMNRHIESNDTDHRSVDVVRAAYECLLGGDMHS